MRKKWLKIIGTFVIVVTIAVVSNNKGGNTGGSTEDPNPIGYNKPITYSI